MSPVDALARRHRLRAVELLPWVAAILGYFAFGEYLTLCSQILIMILFALSLDLVLGYAGIVTLGHSAFFGVGAYAAGIYAAHVSGEPLSGLLIGALAGVVLAFSITRNVSGALRGIVRELEESAQQIDGVSTVVSGAADSLAQEIHATLHHPPLLVRGDFREHRQSQHAAAGFLAGREVPLAVAQVRQTLLQVHRIASFRAGHLGL